MNHSNPALRSRLLAAALILAGTTSALAADAFPKGPVRIVVATSPGGWGDVSTRLVAQSLTESLGTPVVVENRPGAGSLVGIRYAKASPADGYTLLATGGTITIQQAMKLDPGYDVLKDFTAIGTMVRSPVLVVAGHDQPDKTLADFAARAKANPGKLTYASAGIGSATHIPTAMYLQQAKLNVLHVPYKGNGQAMADVAPGRIDIMFDAYSSSAGLLKGGQLKALAVASTSRLAALPDVPTVAESGLPNFSYYYWLGLFAPAGLPAEVTAKLSAALKTALASPQLADRLKADATETMVMSPTEFSGFLAREVTDVNKLVGDLNLPKD